MITRRSGHVMRAFRAAFPVLLLVPCSFAHATAPVPVPAAAVVTPSRQTQTPSAASSTRPASSKKRTATAKRFSELPPAARDAWIDEGRRIESVAERLEHLTRPFIGTPYQVSPLGEGHGTDPDPRLRWDGVDCLTFVETAMAMARAESPSELLPLLDDVRYASLPPSFVNRNHFAEAQWIPNNLMKGYVADIAHEVAGAELLQIETSFGPERWDQQRRPGLELGREDIPRGTYGLNVIPLSIARERTEQIPAGTLLFVVRRDDVYEPTMITHVGIVIDGPKGKVLRHAAQKPYMRVIDERLETFLWRNSRYTKRPVVGVALYEVLDAPSAPTALID